MQTPARPEGSFAQDEPEDKSVAGSHECVQNAVVWVVCVVTADSQTVSEGHTSVVVHVA
jgi:hypothetical protein